MIAIGWCAPQIVAAQTSTLPSVRVQGSVFDSVTKSPLSTALVQFVREDALGTAALKATTDANGRFDLSLTPGAWLAAVSHPRFDSLGVTLPTRKVEVPRSTQYRVGLATPSATTLVHAYCPASVPGDGVIVGQVRDAADKGSLDSVVVTAEWSVLTISRGTGVLNARPSATALTDADGWFVLCSVPLDAEMAAWATRRGATTGVIALPASSWPVTRLDLRLDPSATAVLPIPNDSLESDLATNPGVKRPVLRVGSTRYATLVRDASGAPVVGARARILGRRVALTDRRGVVTLDSLPAGSQTFEVRALGFIPVTMTINVAASGAVPDTVTMLSTKALLDTVRVTGRTVFANDRNGFEARRKNGLGNYITQEQIESRRPLRISDMFQAQSGMRVETYQFNTRISITRAGKPCTPAIFIDGSPSPSGADDLNFVVVPDEVSGIEIYKGPATTPPEFYTPSSANCGSIIIWTRARFRLPKKPVDGTP